MSVNLILKNKLLISISEHSMEFVVRDIVLEFEYYGNSANVVIHKKSQTLGIMSAFVQDGAVGRINAMREIAPRHWSNSIVHCSTALEKSIYVIREKLKL
jgi:hypothetical protein